jgi:hypothetical protein
MLVVSAGHEARVIEVTSIDATDSKVKLKDITKDKTTTDWKTADGSTSIDLGFTSIIMDVNATTLQATTIDSGTIKTEKLAQLSFADADGSTQVNWTLAEDDGSTTASPPAGDSFTFKIYRDTDEDVVVDMVSSPDHPTSMTELEDGSDYTTGASDWGTVFLLDNENKDNLEITYPEEAVYGELFLTPLGAEIIAGGGEGSIDTEKVNPIPVGMSALDKDASSMNKNMIVVGGPCVNVVSAELAGNPANCADGYEAGKAKLKLYTRNGKTALLVAGYSAQDSLGAAYVLADYEDYALSGNEVEVVVASLTDISVMSSS